MKNRVKNKMKRITKIMSQKEVTRKDVKRCASILKSVDKKLTPEQRALIASTLEQKT